MGSARVLAILENTLIAHAYCSAVPPLRFFLPPPPHLDGPDLGRCDSSFMVCRGPVTFILRRARNCHIWTFSPLELHALRQRRPLRARHAPCSPPHAPLPPPPPLILRPTRCPDLFFRYQYHFTTLRWCIYWALRRWNLFLHLDTRAF